jgi:hypothetical protein
MDEAESGVPDYLLVKDRPIGISILALLMFVGGVGCAGLLIYGAFFVSWEERRAQIEQATAALGAPLSLIIGSVVFLSALAIEGGVGMWKGRKRGWWLGSFWYAFAICRNVNALFFVSRLARTLPAEELTAMQGEIRQAYIKFGMRLAVSSLLYLYFFKTNVREFFGLREASRWKAVLVQFAICAAIFAGGTMLASAMN